MEKITRGNSKVIVCPVVHETHGRVTRRTWTAKVVLRTDNFTGGNPDNRIECGHHGHKTTDAAVECATKIWKGLEA
jgi:hypothetical protein